MSVRQCSRTACSRPAVATLTYVYEDMTAVIGPLATLAEPHSYDLCDAHAARLTAPRGWEVVRLQPELVAAGPSEDDIAALADAVRESGRRNADVRELHLPQTGRHGHLRLVQSD